MSLHPAPFAASTTHLTSGLPNISNATLGMLERILVPPPAASINAVACIVLPLIALFANR